MSNQVQFKKVGPDFHVVVPGQGLIGYINHHPFAEPSAGVYSYYFTPHINPENPWAVYSSVLDAISAQLQILNQ